MKNLEFHGKKVNEEFQEFKMDPELKKEWVKALRSGDYIQADGNLYQGESLVDGKYKPECCCLGVLEFLCGTPLDSMEDKPMPCDLDDRRSPKMFWGTGGGAGNCDVGDLLAAMNDGHSDKNYQTYQLSFEGIADFIEENL